MMPAIEPADCPVWTTAAGIRHTTVVFGMVISLTIGAGVICAELICQTVITGKKVLVFGNGGSAADAQHIAAELVGRYEKERRGLPAIALTTDTSALTALANDYAFERIFARQIEALASE